MDGKRFDELVRAMAGSRRGLIRGLAGALGAVGAAKVAGVDAACKSYGRSCSSAGQCCSGACTGGICRCPAGQAVCNKARRGFICVEPCPPDQSLSANCRCLCNRDGRPPVNGRCGLAVNGEDCEVAEDCESNFCNTDDGVCSDPCLLFGESPCISDDDCCSGDCDQYTGACAGGCLDNGEECQSGEECCGGGCNGTCFPLN